MIPILYEASETAFISNGICRLRDCISVVVVEERNGIYECDFEYPVSGANFEEIQCGRIIAVKHDDTDDVQPFDIVSYSKPINGIVSFHAVHISYRLRGCVVEEENVNSLTAALTALATATPANGFTYQADFTANGYAGAFNGLPLTVRQLLGGTEGSILDTYGGEYEWDKFKVILHRARGSTVDFQIRYGLNMVDYNEDVDYSETYTSAVPYWVGDDGNGGETSVVGNKVNSGFVPYNGIDKCVPLDLSEKFETEPTTAELETYALNKMTSQKVNTPQQSIQVDFIRLNDYDEYSSVAPLLQCKLCDSIEVIFPDYQTTAYFKIVRTEYDVLRERFTSMELGTLSTTLAEALGVNGSGGGTSGGGGGGGTTDYNDLSNKPSINNVTLSGNKTSSALGIHEIPSGGSTGQVLTKSSGTNYDVAWTTPSGGGGGVTDVKVDGTSVVTSNVANIPKAESSQFGVMKVTSSPGTLTLTGGVGTYNAALITNGEISYIVLPEATTSTKGAMSSTDKTKLDGIASGAEVNVLEGVQLNSTDLTITNKKVNIPVMTGATTSSAGKVGLVPAPSSMTSGQYKVLLDDGAWHALTGTYLSGASDWYGIINIDSDNYIQFIVPVASSTKSGLITPTQYSNFTLMYTWLTQRHGTIYETIDSSVTSSTLSTAFGGTWQILGQLETSGDAELQTSDGESLFAGLPEIERTYKWVQTSYPM